MQSGSRVVIVGGGMMGVGLLYHLALEGLLRATESRVEDLAQAISTEMGAPISPACVTAAREHLVQ